MRLKQYIFKSFFALSMVSLPALWGCHDYTDDVPEGWGQNQLSEEFQVRIKLTDDSRHISRAVPKGGETGEDREFGQHNENDVNSVLLYYYKGGLDADKTTSVHRLIYKKGIGFHPTGTIDTEVVKKEAIVKFTYAETNYKYTTGDHFIAVINTPDFDVSTLGDLRDRTDDKAWHEPSGATCKGDFDLFVMSNERVSEFTPGLGTETNPHKIDITVERVAARLDYSPDNSTPGKIPAGSSIEADKPALLYTVRDNGTDIGTMYITHVRPFNVMQEPTYLIKRCSTPAGYAQTPKKIYYLADEDAYGGGDYDDFPIVTEPRTWSKAADKNYSSWYGESYLRGVSGDGWFNDEYRVHNNTSNDGFSADGISNNATGECTNYYVVDYANENTQQASASLSNTATGFYLRGIFVPSPTRIFDTAADANAEPQIPSVTFAEGSTFYRYRPMVTEYDETQAVYFTDETEADNFGKSHPVPYVIDTYTNGLCYYPVYLRHDNPGLYPTDTEKYQVTPMEFGIVRNNIYRLKCTFSGPGYNTISTTPSLEPLGIKPYIFVRKWYQIKHPEIEI